MVNLLQEFDINVVKKKSIKGYVIEDLIADFPWEGEEVIHEEFPDIFYEEPYHQWPKDLSKDQQWHYFDEISIPDDYICLLEYETIVWILYFDDSKWTHEVGAAIILVSPTNQVIPMAYKIDFECTNNMVEYEALILGLKYIIILKFKDIEIYGDSQLVVNQVKESFNTKDEKLRPYKVVVLELLD